MINNEAQISEFVMDFGVDKNSEVKCLETESKIS